MPGRNILKIDIVEAYYHVYSRGVNRGVIFLDDGDFRVFLNLLKRYLSPQPVKDKRGREYPHLHGSIELLAYCLMPNHIHLLVYQVSEGALEQLMRGVMTSYSAYFNKKVKRRGPLFESRYRASLISNDIYLQHISRYIHLNPKNWQIYNYSSVDDYLGKRQTEWLQPGRIRELFGDKVDEYRRFLADYADHKKMLDEIKHQLANQD